MPIAGRYRDISRLTQGAYRQQIAKGLRSQRVQLAVAKAKLHSIVREIENDLTPEAIEAVLSVMQTLTENPGRPGAWRDRTGNLRDSILVVILKPMQSKTVDYKHGKTTARNSSKRVVGILLAGMEYAIHLEAKSGYSVLGYAVESLKRQATPALAKKLKLRNLKL